MSVGFFNVPAPINEPVKNYAPGSPERKELQETLAAMKLEVYDIPMYIGDQEIRTGNKVEIRPPHETKHLLGHYHRGTKEHVISAIDAALKAKSKWENLSWEQRSAIFLKAADLIAGPYRAKINAVSLC